MKKFIYSITAIVFVFGLGTSSVSAASPIACPYTASTNTYVVEFPTVQPIFQNAGSNHTAPVSVNIPKGDYDVTFVAWDDHSGHGGQNQYYEVYYLNLYTNGVYFQNIGRSLDIPEGQDSTINIAEGSDSIASGLPFITIRENITSVVASHLHPGIGNWQSVYPICVKFERRVPPTPALTGSCSVSDASVTSGTNVTFTADAAGGTGDYTYVWGNGVSGTTRVVNKSITTDTTAKVRITDSAGTTITKTCNTVTVETPTEGPNVSCSVVPTVIYEGETVTFKAFATVEGDIAIPPTSTNQNSNLVSYFWSGAVNGTTGVVTKRFDVAGTYNATIRITDNQGRTDVDQCQTVVVKDKEVPNNDIAVSCRVSDSNVEEGDRVTFTADVIGGRGSIDYDWSGDVNSNARITTVTVGDEDLNDVRIRVTDSYGNTATDDCETVRVEEEDKDNDDIRVTCEVSETRPEEGDRITFTAKVRGGSGSIDYDWRGDIDGDSRSESVRVRDEDLEVSVRVKDRDGNTDTDECSIVRVEEERGSVLGASVINTPTGNVSSVLLSQVPYTGPADVAKTIAYGLGLLAWSGFLAYYFIKRRNAKLQTSRVEAFKAYNMENNA